MHNPRDNHNCAKQANFLSLYLFWLILVPAQFTVLPQNITVNETNPIVVSCAASGFPAPSISWIKYVQGTAESKDPNTRSSNRSDAGMYVCTASNGVGQDKIAKVYVTVQCKSASQHVLELYVVGRRVGNVSADASVMCRSTRR